MEINNAEANRKRRKHYLDHKDQLNTLRSERRKSDPILADHLRQKSRSRYWRDVEKSRKYARDRQRDPEFKIQRLQKLKQLRKTCPEFKILNNSRVRIHKQLRNKRSKPCRTIDILGCSIWKLREHLESQFKEGMSLENYGPSGWHIDHIRPCASFDLLKRRDLLKCFHFSNLQPLWWRENICKGKKWNKLWKDRLTN